MMFFLNIFIYNIRFVEKQKKNDSLLMHVVEFQDFSFHYTQMFFVPQLFFRDKTSISDS